MNQERFNVCWKVAVLVLLIMAIFWLGYELRRVNMEGLACLKKPACPISLYEQNVDVEKAQEEFFKSLEEQKTKK